MDKREKLISLAIKYEGDYKKLSEAIQRNEECDLSLCDNCLTIFDDDYPKRFLSLKKPPLVLFYKGDIKLLKKETIGVVGSRNPTDYALKATKDLVLNKKDKVIVSGLAKGIDGQAHNYAYKTIAVLGSGIDYIYPLCNKDLYERIAKSGLIISEYPFKTSPYPYHFPFRNRLIAALSDEVYIMEVHDKSGTITTVNEALELGKEIKVLPFGIYDKSASINNILIEEGASIISKKDLLTFDKGQ